MIEKTSFGYRACFEDAVINWYTSGRLLLQGKGASDLAEELYLRGWIETSLEKTSQPRIGVDEAGKGDYFGPLVIAGLVVLPDSEWQLIRLGVRDCKGMAESTVREIAQKLENSFPCSKVIITPQKYNQLYEKMKNLNRILAWGHSRVIENLLEKNSVSLVISDRFANEGFLKKALMKKGKKVKLIQLPRAERDLAVAGASIVARAEFINQLEKLSKKYKMELPRGASSAVLDVGKKFIEKYGEEKLRQIAKLHFKTTQKILY